VKPARQGRRDEDEAEGKAVRHEVDQETRDKDDVTPAAFRIVVLRRNKMGCPGVNIISSIFGFSDEFSGKKNCIVSACGVMGRETESRVQGGS
jgi:hypothetical protein